MLNSVTLKITIRLHIYKLIFFHKWLIEPYYKMP